MELTHFRTRLRLKNGFALLSYMVGDDEAVPLYWIGPPSSSGSIAFTVPRTGAMSDVDMILPDGRYVGVNPPVEHRGWVMMAGDMVYVSERALRRRER